MRPDFADHDLDAEVVFDRFLDGGDLDRFQEVLVSVAPRWCRRLRVWRSSRVQVPVDLSDPGALAAAVLAQAGQRGETHRALAAEHGRGLFDRFVGSAEVRGAGPELTVVVSVDQLALSPSGAQHQFGNGIALQVRRGRVEGRPGAEWLGSAFEVICGSLSPAWGAAWHCDEYWSKVMSGDGSVYAVGRDLGRHLPGVFWRDYFGRHYQDLLGEELLRPAPGTRPVGDGVIAVVGDDPDDGTSHRPWAMSRGCATIWAPSCSLARSTPTAPGSSRTGNDR